MFSKWARETLWLTDGMIYTLASTRGALVCVRGFLGSLLEIMHHGRVPRYYGVEQAWLAYMLHTMAVGKPER